MAYILLDSTMSMLFQFAARIFFLLQSYYLLNVAPARCSHPPSPHVLLDLPSCLVTQTLCATRALDDADFESAAMHETWRLCLALKNCREGPLALCLC